MDFLRDPITFIGNWLQSLLVGFGLAPNLAELIVTLIGAFVLGTFGLTIVLFLIWFERKAVARMQDRFGPNRLGPYGLFQSIADALKLFTKEYITPVGADKVVYNLAPILSVVAVLAIWVVIPFTATVYGSDLNVGVLYIVAVGALGTLSIIMAGWSSNNKYALLGAFRAVAQLVSYEVPMVIALLIPVLLARSMGMNSIVHAQEFWYIFLAPLAFLIFLIASIAEVGRAPFDLLEAESEIVAGFHIEYSGLKFGMFFVGEFLHAFTIAAVAATLFLGGWRGPGVEAFPILGIVYFFLKTFIVYFIVVWVRGTFPRVRIDQMLDFCWKFLTPLALVLLMVIAIQDKLVEGWPPILYALSMLATNIVIALATIQILRTYARRERLRVSGERPVATSSETDFQRLIAQE
jgi:NADH-quinone oxidoreductase subunit H